MLEKDRQILFRHVPQHGLLPRFEFNTTRMAGIEQLSYMSGPLLGNARAPCCQLSGATGVPATRLAP